MSKGLIDEIWFVSHEFQTKLQTFQKVDTSQEHLDSISANGPETNHNTGPSGLHFGLAARYYKADSSKL